MVAGDNASLSQRCEQVFVRAVAALSTVCGIIAALMILASVVITCQMIWMRFVPR
jgi:hypothetical protein